MTSLDLGPEDRDAEFAWGANLAVRRSALERIGRFDPALGGAGDEEDWQRRLRAAGGRIRYVAAAGVDHRRAGADARVRALSRAAFHRGRASRRYDAYKGAAPPLAAELRTLAGCVWHIARRRCGNGIVLTRADRRPPARGARARPRPARARHARLRLGALRAPCRARPPRPARCATPSPTPGACRARIALLRAARRAPRRRVLVLGVARPENARAVARIERELRRSRHAVELHLEPPRAGAGKWANLNAQLAEHPPEGSDWLLLVDDDVRLPRGFLDAFLLCAERFGFQLAQPAHAFASHAAWEVTRRRPGLLARTSRFVEIGPVTAIHRDAFGALLPFPDLQMGWGLDARWSALAAERGWRWGSSTRPRCATGAPSPAPTRATRRWRRPRRSSTAAPTSRASRRARRWPSTGRSDAGRDRRGVLPAGRRPRPGRVGAPAGAGRARRGRRRARAGAAPARARRRRRSRARDAAELLAPLRQPLRAELDGIDVRYVPFLAPPRPRSYGGWGAWAAPTLALALRRLRREFPYDLVHAHYAAPGGDAVRRARPGAPYVVSVHGGDVLSVARRRDGERAVREALGGARLVLANSAAIGERARALGARATRVVHLGTDVPGRACQRRRPARS